MGTPKSGRRWILDALNAGRGHRHRRPEPSREPREPGSIAGARGFDAVPAPDFLARAAQAPFPPPPSVCRCPACSTFRIDSGAVEARNTAGAASAAGAATGTVASLALADTFKLHSNPFATTTIYLDFDGHLIPAGSAWSVNYNGGKAINAPAWSIDGDPTSFNDQERGLIQRIWQRVAEDFAPFNIDVTTEYRGEDYLTRSSLADLTFGTRALISPISSYFGNYGGIAYLDVFDAVGDTYKPALIFPEKLGPNSEKFIAEAISHEVGHNLGLSHDGTATQGYYSGQGSGENGWAPIMGVGYSQPLSQWSKGEYSGANQTQDDLQIITSKNGFGYRSDAAGNSAGAASSLDIAGTNATTASLLDVFQFGIIETRADLDWFGFTTGAGTISFSVGSITEAFVNTGSGYLSSYVTAPDGSTNLDIWAGLYASDGTTLLTWSNPLDGLGASFSYQIQSAGTYYLAIDGVGEGDPLTTGYSDYGSLGQYLISGTIVATAPLPGIVVTPTSGLTTTEGGGTATLTVVLATAPLADVTIAIGSNDSTEGVPGVASLTFTPGNWNVAQTVIVRGVDDGLIDGAQPYQIQFDPASSTDPAYNGLDPLDVSLTNLDNDLPLLSISSPAQTVVEGQRTSLSYTLSLSNPSQGTVTVNYATSDGTAIAGSDYSASSGTLSFAAGQTTKSITVALLNDANNEVDETFSLSLSAPSNATLGSPASVTTTLTDTLVATTTTILPAGVENLQLAGTSAINGTGNSGANVITGNSSDNVLKGGGGIDILTGLEGRDSFDLSGLSNAANRCTITDFTSGDSLRLSDSLTSRNGSTPTLVSVAQGSSVILDTSNADLFAFNFANGESDVDLAASTSGSALLDGLNAASGSASLSTTVRGGRGYIVAYDNDNAYLYAFNAGGNTSVSASEIALIGNLDSSSAITVGALTAPSFVLV